MLEKSIEHRLKAKSYEEQCRRLEAEVATLKAEATQLRAELTAAAKYEGQVQMSQQQVEFLRGAAAECPGADQVPEHPALGGCKVVSAHFCMAARRHAPAF